MINYKTLVWALKKLIVKILLIAKSYIIQNNIL
jgi:hypothetical protein